VKEEKEEKIEEWSEENEIGCMGVYGGTLKKNKNPWGQGILKGGWCYEPPLQTID